MLCRIFTLSLLISIGLHSQAALTQKSIHFAVEPSSLNLGLATTPSAYSLNALFQTDDTYSQPPLIVLSHGAPVHVADRPNVLPEKMQSRGKEFVKLGFAVLIVERRGYGHSTEKYAETFGKCDQRDYMAGGRAASLDILGAVQYAKSHLGIDAENIVLAGQSAGGFSSVFASQYPVSGLKAVLNFSGGRGANRNHAVCSEQALLKAYSTAGSTSRVPTLWIYSENDQLFSPDLVKGMLQSFQSAGGQAEFHMLPPYKDNGHNVFSVDGTSIWLPLVKQFLSGIQLCLKCL